ncbi:hypothetical protein glysoja_040814 [Glycine soja]|uniref:LisH domain-containing protein n=1 Tax=Glycine soja TaxID=3848 RepID=A0A0B2QZ77_GLYSO|nr:hypothetical protein glysoja_040814 [Glycine soja]
MDKINPALVALMVHQYLRDNHFSQTSSIFLNEASSLFTDSSTNQLSKTMLGLVQILDEYMCLKKQKEMLHQQRVMVIQEKYRLQMFVQGLKNVINTFQKPLSLNVVGMSTNSAVVPQWRLCNETPSGLVWIDARRAFESVSSIASIGSAMQNTFGNFSTPMISASDKKRKDTEIVNGPAVGKKPRGRPPGRKNQVQESSHCNSPIEADTGKTSKKDDVRGKLNFDASNMPESLDKSLANEVSTSELDKGVVISDIDFSNLDWSLQGTSFEDFFDPIGLTDSKDNASSSRP